MFMKILCCLFSLTEKSRIKDLLERSWRCLASRIKRTVCQISFQEGSSRELPLQGLWQASPAIILADEPTGNLDSRTSQEVLGLLKLTGERFHQTIVMITHNDAMAQLSDRVIRIEDGKIVGGAV